MELLSARNKAQINNMLGSYGLGQLDDAAGLCSQLGFLIRDHEHFRQMLAACDPAMRRDMYDSLKLSLRFKALPFDSYMIETARQAEVKQLPIQNPDGTLRAYSPPEAKSKEAEIIQNAVEDGLAKGWLELICKKCTRFETFPGANKAAAIHAAREAGWTYDEVNGEGREICPSCP
jgi:hypothetical protein